MIDEKTLTENSVAEYLCEVLDKHRNEQPLKDEDMKILLTLLMMPAGAADKMFEEIIEKSWALKAVEARQKTIFGNELIDRKTLILIEFLCSDNIGMMLMHVYYLQWKAVQLGIDKIDLNIFCERIFPFGTFKEKTLHKVWDDTKVRTERMTNNLIDYTFCTKSFNKNVKDEKDNKGGA